MITSKAHWSNSWNRTWVTLVVLAGNFNQLDVAEVSARVGLHPLVSQLMAYLEHDNDICPLTYSIEVMTSTVRSDHAAILATTTLQKDYVKASTIRAFSKGTPVQHA